MFFFLKIILYRCHTNARIETYRKYHKHISSNKKNFSVNQILLVLGFHSVKSIELETGLYENETRSAYSIFIGLNRKRVRTRSNEETRNGIAVLIG